MYNGTVSGVNRYVVNAVRGTIEQKISRLKIVYADRSTSSCLIRCYTIQ